jgi:isoquinoline 1-oxidoreductase beta subunit
MNRAARIDRRFFVAGSTAAAGLVLGFHIPFDARSADAAADPQTQSAIACGLTAALFGEISIKNGRVEQSNFHDYRMLRMADMPRVETLILPSEGFWGGVGELAVPPLAPALCNAVFAATEKRIRSLPLKNHALV